jgi:regulator of protease activity HflC (stomatin/prohibitin superfamily)
MTRCFPSPPSGGGHFAAWAPRLRGILTALVLFVSAGFACAGCATTVIQPGHRGLLFDRHTGLGHNVLGAGYYHVGANRIDDFDVTYSSRAEQLHVITVEGLALDVSLSVIYRPVVAELYELDTEVGPTYYEDILGPELRAASRACFAGHSFLDVRTKKSVTLEDEIEADLRQGVKGKHLEVASVTLTGVELPADLRDIITKKLVAETEAQRQKAEADRAWEKEKLELERDVVRQRLRREAEGGAKGGGE